MKIESENDRQNELTAQQIIGARWGCTFRSFGDLCSIDWTIHKAGRLVGVAEFKRRHRNIDDFKTVYLNVQKWLSLTFTAIGLEVKAFFIVQFDDGVYFVDLANVDASRHRVCGRDDRSRGADVQPVIEIPTAQFKKIAEPAIQPLGEHNLASVRK
jgi:hypothetical protein